MRRALQRQLATQKAAKVQSRRGKYIRVKIAFVPKVKLINMRLSEYFRASHVHASLPWKPRRIIGLLTCILIPTQFGCSKKNILSYKKCQSISLYVTDSRASVPLIPNGKSILWRMMWMMIMAPQCHDEDSSRAEASGAVVLAASCGRV